MSTIERVSLQHAQKNDGEALPNNPLKEYDVQNQELIGHGSYGDVFRSALRFENNHTERLAYFAIKQYREKTEPQQKDREMLMNRISDMYARSKEAGLPVLPTFRLDKKQHLVVMTDWSAGGAYAVSEWRTSIPEQDRIERISNMESLATEVFAAATTAAAHDIHLYGDPYFFRHPKAEKVTHVDFVIGDFDGMEYKDDSEERELSGEKLRFQNLAWAVTALTEWLRCQFKDNEALFAEHAYKVREVYLTLPGVREHEEENVF